jgi:hypothetical protein
VDWNVQTDFTEPRTSHAFADGKGDLQPKAGRALRAVNPDAVGASDDATFGPLPDERTVAARGARGRRLSPGLECM